MEHPKIGLALGSGGARGFAHLGVIKGIKRRRNSDSSNCWKQYGSTCG